jgi:hypothetical protein
VAVFHEMRRWTRQLRHVEGHRPFCCTSAVGLPACVHLSGGGHGLDWVGAGGCGGGWAEPQALHPGAGWVVGWDNGIGLWQCLHCGPLLVMSGRSQWCRRKTKNCAVQEGLTVAVLLLNAKPQGAQPPGQQEARVRVDRRAVCAGVGYAGGGS